MKRRLLFSLFAAMALCCGCGKTPSPEEEETLPEILTKPATVLKSQSVLSTAMGASVKFSVWFPPTYDNTKTYPVLYLLHGYENDPTDAHNKWLSTEMFWGQPNGGSLNSIATKYVRDGGELFIIVTPNCPNDFYRNFQGGDQYETFFVDEFIPYIENTYHGNGKRAIAGLSMGGYGTLYHGFLHPEKYTYMYAMSPATDMSWYEPQPTLATLAASCDPAKMPGLTIETGTEDTTVSLESVQNFVAILKAQGVKHEFITRAGTHSWGFWQGCLPKALKKAGESFK